MINAIVGKSDDAQKPTQLTTKKDIYHDSIDFVVDEYQSYMVVRYDSFNYNDDGVTNEHSDVSTNEYIEDMMSGIVSETSQLTYQKVYVGQIFGRGDDSAFKITAVHSD